MRERNEGRRRDREQEKREQEALAAQAATVAAWPDRTTRGEKHPYVVTVIRIRNGSELPVYDVHLEVEDLTGQRVNVVPLGVVPPGSREAPVPAAYEERFVRTLAGWMRNGADSTGEREKVGEPAFEPYLFGVSVRFRDARGASWRRGVDGLLQQTS